MAITSFFKKRTERLLSIDFSQKELIKIACVESSAGDFKLLNYNFKKLSSSSADKKTETIYFIKDFIKRHSLEDKKIYLTISDPSSMIIRSLDLPVFSKREVLEAAQWQLKEDAPFNLEDAVCDWQSVREYTDEEGAKKNKVIFILAKRESIEYYLSIVYECGLEPVSISSSPFNYANILRQFKEAACIQAVIDIGGNDAALSIYDNHKLTFIRILAFSLDRLTKSLTGALLSDRGKIELSYEEAKYIREAFGIPQEPNVVLIKNIGANQIISLMRPLLEGLARELKTSFDYFSSTLDAEVPLILYLTGEGANLKNFSTYLNKELNIKVAQLPIPHCIKTGTIENERLNKDCNLIINALGAVLLDSQAINLVPQEIKTQKLEFMQKVFLKLITLTAGAVFLFSLFTARFQINDYKNRLKNAKMHLQIIEEIRALRQAVSLRESLINNLRRDNIPVDGLFKLISTLVTDKIILDELTLDQNQHSLILKGSVLASQDIAESILTTFMEKIEASAFFSEASLVFSNRITGAQVFEIKCDLVH